MSVSQTSPAQYNQTTFNLQLQSFEKQWQSELWGQQGNQTWSVSGQDPLAVVRQMRAKWAAWL